MDKLERLLQKDDSGNDEETFRFTKEQKDFLIGILCKSTFEFMVNCQGACSISDIPGLNFWRCRLASALNAFSAFRIDWVDFFEPLEVAVINSFIKEDFADE